MPTSNETAKCQKCGEPVERVIGVFTRFRCGTGRDSERDRAYQSDACRIRELQSQLTAATERAERAEAEAVRLRADLKITQIEIDELTNKISAAMTPPEAERAT